MILAHLQKNGEDYSGVYETLTRPAASIHLRKLHKQHDRMPDYRVYIGESDVGAGWVKPKGHVLVTLDDPSFLRPAECRLVREDEGFVLIWDRDR